MVNILPENEGERLAALREYDILDTLPENAFDDLASLAATVCGAPTALISLIDERRQWFKARFNLNATETPRNISFCQYTILNPGDTLVVEDAERDVRFACSPLVTGEPHIRFYAGAPLVTSDGFALGSLCVIDYVPRRLTGEQLNALKLIARQVVAQLELRRAARENNTLASRRSQILAQATDGIYLFDADGRITSANRRFYELTGRDEAETGTIYVRDLFAGEPDYAGSPVDSERLRAGETLLSERKIKRVSGEAATVEISEKMIDRDTVQAFMHDVSERRRTRRRLSESEGLFRDFVENSLALFCTHDETGKLMSVNPAAADALGYAPEEIIGRNLSELLLPSASELMSDYLDEIKKNGKLSGYAWVTTKMGEKRIWSYNNVLRRDADGAPYILGSAQDITELKNKEEELTKSRRLFDSFINNSPAMIFLKDEEGRYQFINQPCEELFRIGLDEVRGQTDFYFMPKEAAEKARANDRTVFETEQPLETTEIIPTPDGVSRYWLINKFLIKDDRGKRLVGGIAVDITERKRMEAELRSAYDAALESMRLKSAFLTNVSHEIRTPMNGVIGMTELLLDTPLDPTQRDYAETIRLSSDALLTVINDILDLAKIESGKLRFEAVDFDPREVVESTVEMFADRSYRKNVEIASLVEADVPPVLRGDRGRLRQVLTNLIGNAVKFTESGGGVAVTVEAAGQTATQTVLSFCVSDTGIGIAAPDMKNLFQPFVQVDDSSTRRFGGTGLGLVISKQIVEMMNGEIAVESRPREGSKFSFTASFPKIANHTARAVSADEKSDAENAAELLKGKRILIADPSPIIRRTLEKYCLNREMIATGAAGGGDALAEMRRAADAGKPFDLAVVDMNLPDWENFALAERIRAEPAFRDTKIILTTAYGQRGDAAAARTTGVSGYLTKPIRGAQIFDCLVTVLTDERQSPTHSDTDPARLVTRHSLREAKAQVRAVEPFFEQADFRLLVVEDNEVNRLVVTRQLAQIGISADVAEDGVFALEKFDAADYNLILMDCQMPRLDGYETTREIRRRENERSAAGEKTRRTVIVALTAHSLDGEREKCLAAGMDDYMSKPIKIRELSAMIRQWSGASRSDDNLVETTGEPDADAPFADAGFDAGQFQTLFAGEESEEFASEILSIYLTETEKYGEELKKALEDEDLSSVGRIVHAVKGNSLAVGAISIVRIMERIEDLKKTGAAGEIGGVLSNFSAELSILKKQSENYIRDRRRDGNY